MTNLDSILKSRDITLSAKVHLVKAMVFPVVMYWCESWTIKKAECRRIDAFELWCWRRLLRVPWTARRSNQSSLKEISPGCSLEGLMLKLKLQYFGHLIRTDSLRTQWPLLIVWLLTACHKGYGTTFWLLSLWSAAPCLALNLHGYYEPSEDTRCTYGIGKRCGVFSATVRNIHLD